MSVTFNDKFIELLVKNVQVVTKYIPYTNVCKANNTRGKRRRTPLKQLLMLKVKNWRKGAFCLVGITTKKYLILSFQVLYNLYYLKLIHSCEIFF